MRRKARKSRGVEAAGKKGGPDAGLPEVTWHEACIQKTSSAVESWT